MPFQIINLQEVCFYLYKRFKKKFIFKDVEITAEEEKLRDPEGFAAICELHQLMDDDRSGSIDRFESADVCVNFLFFILILVFKRRLKN